MANRRMFSMSVVDTDHFLDLPSTAQALYFHLAIRADDDGFVSSPTRIMKMIGSSGDDLKLLIAKEYVLPFESGVCVIKHWLVHNYIKKDRYTPTFYKLEKSLLITSEDKTYIYGETKTDTECIQDVSKTDTQVSLGKSSLELGKGSKEEEQVTDIDSSKSAVTKKVEYADYVKMTEDEYEKLLDEFGKKAANEMIEILDNYKGSTGRTYKNDYRTIHSWVVKRWKEEHPGVKDPKNPMGVTR